MRLKALLSPSRRRKNGVTSFSRSLVLRATGSVALNLMSNPQPPTSDFRPVKQFILTPGLSSSHINSILHTASSLLIGSLLCRYNHFSAERKIYVHFLIHGEIRPYTDYEINLCWESENCNDRQCILHGPTCHPGKTGKPLPDDMNDRFFPFLIQCRLG